MVSRERMMNMQQQVRQNADELQHFLKDLDSWQSDIKKQDSGLQTMKGDKQNVVTPIRNAAAVKAAKEKVDAKKKKNENPQTRIRSSDYKAWDKLNVDKMLEDISDEEKEVEEELQKTVEIETEIMKDKTSTEMKEEGNFHFKNGRYDTAIRCYTRGIQNDPSNAVLPANRAMAYLKLEKFTETEADCTLSLSLDPTYTKAYLRRGVARVSMGKVDSAKKDFNDVLKLDPGNKQAVSELKKINDMVKPKEKELEPSFIPPKPKRGFVNPIFIPKNKRSKKPLVRIPVQEVGFDENTLLRINDTRITSNKLQFDKENISEISQPNISEKQKSKPTVSKPGLITVLSDGDGNAHRTPEEANTSATKPQSKHQPPSRIPASTDHSIPGRPQTSFQLQADVKKLRNTPDNLCRYLMQIPPNDLPRILKEQIEADLLMGIISGLQSDEAKPESIIEYLRSVSQVKRFDFAIMFLSNHEKAGIQRLFDKLQSEQVDASQVLELKKKYSI